MNYTKPEIVLGESALVAIQSTPAKPRGTVFDSAMNANVGTINAYEADE